MTCVSLPFDDLASLQTSDHARIDLTLIPRITASQRHRKNKHEHNIKLAESGTRSGASVMQ
jgi:hypothetical protein